MTYQGTDPLEQFFSQQEVIILDGGLASELELHGFDLNHPLWSARVLLENPMAIKKVHQSYLEAGSDCLISSSYQISFEGCQKLGMSERETMHLLEKSIQITIEAVESFMDEVSSDASRIRPLVAASVGPYGAYLADGSEYKGNYSISNQELYDFHVKRWNILANTPCDMMICETIPSFRELGVILELSGETRQKPVIISFSCQDEKLINDGTPIRECVKDIQNCSEIIAVGINCTSPKYISGLIKEIREVDEKIEIAVYPNSGELYDGSTRSWMEEDSTYRLSAISDEWFKLGARIIGGCCRVGPCEIGSVRSAMIN